MLLKSSGISFNNLSADGYAAFVLAIIFTIITLASFIYLARHKEINSLLGAFIEYVFPTLTVFCWMYLIFNVTSFSMGYCLLYAFTAAVAFLIVAVAIGLIVCAWKKGSEQREEQKAAQAEENKEDDVLMLEAPAEEEHKEEEVVVEEAAAEEPAEEPVEEPAEETTEEAEENEDEPKVEGVIFNKGPKLTFAEQLAKLSAEELALYNEILEYAQAKEDTKTMESNSHVMVKIGRLRLLELKFLREKLVCKFMAGSSEIKNYSLAEKSVKIKEKPITIELVDESSLAVAKNMVDIVFKNIVDAKEEKKANEVVAPVSDEVPEGNE